MSADVVVDVGNTRIKWGRCHAGRVTHPVSLPPDDPDAWRRQVQDWATPSGARWLLAGVHPSRRDGLRDWLRDQGFEVDVIDSYRQLPLALLVEAPERVGIDRLLDAVAANARRDAGRAAIIVDAGSAVTVDLVDGAGAFRGGAIFPGLRLMAQALNQYTALLPVVEVNRVVPPPGASTATALATGIYHAVVGGIERLVSEMDAQAHAQLFVTGGDAALLATALKRPHCVWPEMTLTGIHLSACKDSASER